MNTMAYRQETARYFAAFAHPRRLLICEHLEAAGRRGMGFQYLMRKTRLKASTLSHHLERMDRGGILHRRQNGRETWFSLRPRVPGAGGPPAG